MTSDSEGESDAGTRPSSRNSARQKVISRPFFRNANGSYALPTSATTAEKDSDTYSLSTASVISTTSTIRPVQTLSLIGINHAFFHATLEYLYTAEESMVDAFDFLFEDRAPPEQGEEERLAKLREDFTFMWRSKLFADIKITLGDDAAYVPSIPDPTTSTMSVTSLPMDDDEDPDDEATSFASHRMILVSRSPYFASQLLSPYADAAATVVHLPTPPFTPAALHFTLGFLYTGTLAFSNRTFDLTTAMQLWRCGAYLQVDSLQRLVSAHMTHELCHSLTCDPPCKKCAKRVPRVLAFASSPDVGDTHLATTAQAAVSGPHFGTYWAKEVGNMPYALRGSLVSDLCARLEADPASCIPILRQLSQVCARVDSERSLGWVANLRWMCDALDVALREALEGRLEDIVRDEAWEDLLGGVGFGLDVLRKLLRTLLEGLSERRAPRIYEVLVGHVLLSETNPPVGEVRDLVEETRLGIVKYIRGRWVSIRALGAFEGLENWALKELSDEVDVRVEDLLMSQPPKQEGPLSRTGLRATVPATRGGATRGKARVTTGAAARPAVVEGEREAGPIDMRASVLNRNAARTSVSSARILGGSDDTSNGKGKTAPGPTRSQGSARVEGDVESRRSSAASSSSAAAWRAAQAERLAAAAAAAGTAASGANARQGGAQKNAPRRAPSTTSVRSNATTASSVVRKQPGVRSTAAQAQTRSRTTSSVSIASTSTSASASTSRSIPSPVSPVSADGNAMDVQGGGDGAEKTPTASLLSVRENVVARTPSPSASSKRATVSSTTTTKKPPSLRSARSDISMRSTAARGGAGGVLGENKATAVGSEVLPGTPKGRAFLRATPKPDPSPRARRISGMSSTTTTSSVAGGGSGARGGGAAKGSSGADVADATPRALHKTKSAASIKGTRQVSVGAGAGAGSATGSATGTVKRKTTTTTTTTTTTIQGQVPVTEPLPLMHKDEKDVVERETPRALEVVQPTPTPTPTIAVSDAMDVDPAPAASAAAETHPTSIVQSTIPDVKPAATAAVGAQPAGADAPSHGTSLTHGVPCILAPRLPGSLRALRFRGSVKYIGPLAGQVGQWVGIEITLPLPEGLEGGAAEGSVLAHEGGKGFLLGDGTYRGKRYFQLGEARDFVPGGTAGGNGEVDFAKPEREARRRRVARLVGAGRTVSGSATVGAEGGTRDTAAAPATTTTEYEEAAQPNAKRYKLRAPSTRKTDAPLGPSKGLFVRPADVLWVVAPE